MIPLHNNVVHYEIPSKSTPNFHFKMFQVPISRIFFWDSWCQLWYGAQYSSTHSRVSCVVFCCAFESVLVTSSKQRLEHVLSVLHLLKLVIVPYSIRCYLVKIFEREHHILFIGLIWVIWCFIQLCAKVHLFTSVCIHAFVLGRLVKELVTLKDWKIVLRTAHDSKCQKIIST